VDQQQKDELPIPDLALPVPEVSVGEEPATISFTDEGHALGGSGSAAPDTENLTPQERRLRALEAAQRRQATIAGVSQKKAAAIVDQQQKDELLRKIADHYSKRKIVIPMGVNSASLEQLKKHWDGLRTQAAQDLKPEVAEPRPAETGEVSLSPSAKLARKVQEEQAKKVEEDKARMVQEEARRVQEEQTRRVQEEARRVQEEQARKAEQSRMDELMRKTPRSMLACASTCCTFMVNSRPELGGYCCIVCSETGGGDHGPRCERSLAPKGAVKADPNWLSMQGAQLEILELEEAVRVSMSDAGVVPAGVWEALASPPVVGKTQEELDLEEAIRLSMMDACGPVTGVEDDGHGSGASGCGADTDEDSDGELPPLVPLEPVQPHLDGDE